MTQQVCLVIFGNVTLSDYVRMDTRSISFKEEKPPNNG